MGQGAIQVMTLSDLVSLWLQEEEAGGEQDALALYQHGLEELLLLLAGEAPPTSPQPRAPLPCLHHCALPLFAAEPPGRRRELLHTEVPTRVGRVGRLPPSPFTLLSSGEPSRVPLGCSMSRSQTSQT